MREATDWLLSVAIIAISFHSATPFDTGPPLDSCTSMQPGTNVGTTGIEGHTTLPMNYQPGAKSRTGPYYIDIHGYEDHYLPDTDYKSEFQIFLF